MGKCFFPSLLFNYFRQPKINENELILQLTKTYIFRLDVIMHQVIKMH